MLPRVLAWLVAVWVFALSRPAFADPGFTDRCDAALPKHQVDELVERMRAVDGPCRLERVDTTVFRTVIEWAANGDRLVVLLGPRGCVVEPSFAGEDLAVHAPEALATACPQALAAVREFVGEPREIAVISGSEDPAWTSDREAGSFADPIVVATAAWIAMIGLAFAAAWHWRPSPAGKDRPGLLVGAGTFALALAVRFGLDPTIGNWYGSFLPAEGWGELRFGSAAAVLQAGIRAIGPWTPDVAFGLFRIVGALAVPLTVALVRRLGGSLGVATAAGILLAVAPVPVRLSASSSEHVIAATLALAAWVTWVGTASDGAARPRVLAVVLAWLAVMSRADCLPQLALIPVWTVVGARLGAHGRGWLPIGRRVADACWFGACLAAIAVHAWFEIVIPSNHPSPQWSGIQATVGMLISQFWIAMIEPPHWITPVMFVLGILGLGFTIAHRRWRLLAATAISIGLIFVPLGRNLSHDGLTGARYFVLLFPLVAAIAAAPFESWSTWIPDRFRVGVGVGLVAGLGGVAAWSAQPGWSHEYTFQAEYRFLARVLADRGDVCTLWYVRPRQTTGEPDLDCCLSPADSPLTLLAPAIRFRAMPLAGLPPADGCQLWYEGSVCSIDPTTTELSPLAVGRILDQCERLRQRAAAGRELASEGVTAVTLNPRFEGRPWVRLSATGIELE